MFGQAPPFRRVKEKLAHSKALVFPLGFRFSVGPSVVNRNMYKYVMFRSVSVFRCICWIRFSGKTCCRKTTALGNYKNHRNLSKRTKGTQNNTKTPLKPKLCNQVRSLSRLRN